MKMKDFRLLRARDLDLDLGWGHTAYRILHTVVHHHYLHAKFHCSRRFFVDGRAYVRTYTYM